MLHADSGRAVLMDFGIARPSETDSSMTQTGTAIGTPHYMSPEQARGQVVDSRSDLYSLGVVLFLMLTGHVPFDADSAVAVGIKHVSEPTPRLPTYLQAFQGIINKILSKDPEHRYQTGDELIVDLDALPPYALAEVAAWESAQNHDDGASNIEIDTDADTLVGHPAVASSVLLPEPAEPKISLSREGRVAYQEAESGNLWPWVTALMLAAGVALTVYYQQQLPADYRVSVASDNDINVEPLSGQQAKLGSVEASSSRVVRPLEGTAVTDQAAVLVGDVATALLIDASMTEPVVWPASELNIIGEVMAGTESSVIHSRRLMAASESSATVPGPTMVASTHTSAVLEEGRDEVPSNREDRLVEAADWVARGLADPKLASTLIPQAADRYRQLLGRDPTDAQARQSLRSIRDEIHRQARRALELQYFPEVERLLALAAATFPQAATEPKFQRIQQRMQAAINVRALLEQAGERLQANALTTPAGNNAAEYFEQVLVLKPQHPLAREGLSDIARRYAVLARKQLATGDLQRAQSFVARGMSVDGNSRDLHAIATRIEQRQLLMSTLRRADQLHQQGNTLAPVGGSALELYRAVIAQQPRQSEALAGLARIEDDLVSTAESFISSNDYQQATAEISRALFFFPASQTLQDLQRINERAIADMMVASQPRISKVLVSNQVMASLLDAQPQMLAVDRTIHVGFYFQNFEAATSVVQAVLFDGARRLQIAQVPVIVSGQEGAQFFRIERPVEGFADGGYSIDLMFKGQRLSSADFEVNSRSEL
jgi:tetratricopeptide (TPR) repeat protein